jgi:DNA-directed RNA polymerase specialized sigma24 family protein
MLGRLEGLKLAQIALNLGVSPQAVGQRLRAAGARAVARTLARFSGLIQARRNC